MIVAVNHDTHFNFYSLSTLAFLKSSTTIQHPFLSIKLGPNSLLESRQSCNIDHACKSWHPNQLLLLIFLSTNMFAQGPHLLIKLRQNSKIHHACISWHPNELLFFEKSSIQHILSYFHKPEFRSFYKVIC